MRTHRRTVKEMTMYQLGVASHLIRKEVTGCQFSSRCILTGTAGDVLYVWTKSVRDQFGTVRVKEIL